MSQVRLRPDSMKMTATTHRPAGLNALSIVLFFFSLPASTGEFIAILLPQVLAVIVAFLLVS